jgi:hypothetical protein
MGLATCFRVILLMMLVSDHLKSSGRMGRNISSPKPHSKKGCSDVPEFQISGTSVHIEASDTRGMQEQKNHKNHNSGNNAPASLEKGQN